MSATTSTTYTFAPSATASPPFSFQATFDGSTYSVAVTWNVYGQRWYFNISDLDGNLVLSWPLIGSSPISPINLLATVFVTSTMFYYDQTAQIVVSP